MPAVTLVRLMNARKTGPAVTSASLAVVGLVCALLSALGTNLAFLFKLKGAVAAPDVDMRHPLRSAVDLFRSRWWSIVGR